MRVRRKICDLPKTETMNSLFLKIFLWFWLATVLVVAALILATEITRSRPTNAPPFISGTMTIYSQNAARAFEREGVSGLNQYLAEIESQTQIKAAIFDGDGKDWNAESIRNIPEAVKKIAMHDDSQDKTVLVPYGSEVYLVRRAALADNQSLVLFALLFKSLFEGFSFSLGSYVLRVLFVLLTAGLLCYWLARYIASPVAKIRNATQQLAAGDLSVRVSPVIGRRRDELANMGRDFDRMAERIESLMSAHWRLLRDISHELRSPLARLNIGLALARRRVGADASGALDRIEQESAQLNEMVDRLLELDRWEFSAEELPREPIDLARLLGEVAADADFEARSQNRRVIISRSENCFVTGVSSLVRSAIENVVRNAIRHTDEDTTVEISLRCEQKNGAAQAIITVSDGGAGVPEESIAELFQPFYRVDDARDRESGGTGLGLAITERAVKLHHGTVSAANAPDKGFIIEIRLPVVPTSEKSAERNPA